MGSTGSTNRAFLEFAPRGNYALSERMVPQQGRRRCLRYVLGQARVRCNASSCEKQWMRGSSPRMTWRERWEIAMRDLRWRRCSAAAAVLAATLVVSPASGQSGADFFKGKTVTYIVATSPGGGYDTYGRLVAEYMQHYLPGSTFIVKNMPGAGHMIGTNAIYASRPDGLTIGTFNTGLIYNQLIRHEAARFDLEKMSWVGKAAYDPRVMAIAVQSPIRTYQDLVGPDRRLHRD